MIRVRITNPTQDKRSYSWVQRGLELEAGESVVVDYDPFVKCKNGMQSTLLSRDLQMGFVKLTYAVKKPCEFTSIDEIASFEPVKKETNSADKVQNKPKKTKQEQVQIKTVLEEVKGPEQKVVEPLIASDKSQSVVEKPAAVEILGNADLTDDGEMLVTVSNEKQQSKPVSKPSRKSKVKI